MKSFKDFLNESLNEAFSIKNAPRALELITNYLEKNIRGIYALPGVEVVKKKSGETLAGVQYINKQGKGFRINWLYGNSAAVHSVDFFEPEQMFGQPKITMRFEGESVARFLPAIVEVFNKMKTNIDPEKFADDDLVEELHVLDEGRRPGSLNKKTLAMVEDGTFETKITPAVKTAEKLLDETPYADPDTIFDDIDSYVDMVTGGIQPSLIICGGPGIGKTYGITKRIKDNGLREIQTVEIPDGLTMDDLRDIDFDPTVETEGDWVHVKGSSTAFGLYANLFKYKEKLIVFDDCDSVFTDKDGVNVLKGALDSSDKRVISWITAQTLNMKKAMVPPKFEFKGRIIFISNLPMMKVDSAIRNRSFVLDVKLRTQDVIKRIQTILPAIGNNLDFELTMEAKQKAVQFLQSEVDSGNTKLEISIRSLVNFAKIAQSGVPTWERLMKLQAINMSF